jgi:hypothetical protein
LGIFGCQSTLDVAGGEHKTVAEKWLELSKYAESSIDNYGVIVTARLATTVDKKFKLTHFKINNSPSRQDINLLAPNFEHKYICSPVCSQLIEYVSFSGDDGTTLLTNYFDRHEFELFKFYGDIQLLNKQLVKLAKYDQLLLKSYLTSLAYQETSFESAKEFIQFLTTALTLSSLEHFEDNPEDLLSHFLKSYQAIRGSQWRGVSQEQDEWSDITKEQDKWSVITKELNEWSAITKEQEQWADISQEQDEWTISTDIPELAWSTDPNSLPEAIWLQEKAGQTFSTDGIKSTNNISDDEQLSWQSAKASPIKVGYNVCSYKGSFFGLVSAISSDKVMVNVLGQAKIIIEGIVYPARDGDLFTMNEDLYFSPLSEKKQFEKSDIASCRLE